MNSRLSIQLEVILHQEINQHGLCQRSPLRFHHCLGTCKFSSSDSVFYYWCSDEE